MIIGGLRPGNPQTNRPNKFGANVQETMVGSTALLYISIGTNLFITCGVSKVREIPHENAWFWEIETHGYSKQTYLGWPVFPRNFSQLLSFSSLWTVEKIPKKKRACHAKPVAVWRSLRFLPRQSFCFVARWYGSFSTLVFFANVSRFFGEEQRLCWLSNWTPPDNL